MVEPCDDVGKEAADVGADVPLVLQKLLVVDGVGADDPVEEPLLVGLVELLDGISREEGEADGGDNLGGPLFLQEFHGLQQGAASSQHIVRQEGHLSLHVTKQLHRLDVGGLGILGHHGIIPLLVNHGQRCLQSRGIELVAVDGTGVGGNYNQVLGLVGQVHQPGKLPDNLVAGMEVIKVGLAEGIHNFPGVDVQCDDAGDPHVLVDVSQKAGGEPLPPLLLVLAAVGIHGHHQGDGVGTRLVDGIDGHQHGHDVVIDREHLGVLAAVELQGLVVLHILEDVHILSPDALVDFSLELTVHEVGELGVHLEAGNPILVGGATDA